MSKTYSRTTKMDTFEYIVKSRRVSSSDALVKSSEIAATYLAKNCYDEEGMHDESCFALLLAKDGRLLGFSRISEGGSECCVMDIKKIARIAILKGAAKVILSHNHPSGNITPSHADITQTDKTRKALALLEIELTDHIIMAPDLSTYYSFSDECIREINVIPSITKSA